MALTPVRSVGSGNGVQEMILPEENKAHVEEDVPAHLREGMTFDYVKTLNDVLKHAFAGDALTARSGATTAKARHPASPPPGAAARPH